MPFCPQCRAEFVEGIGHCANCDLDLVEQLPDLSVCESHASMANYLKDKEILAIASGDFEKISQLQEKLRQTGVPSAVTPAENAAMAGVHAIYQLAIAQDDIEAAHEVFEASWFDGLQMEGTVDPNDYKSDVIDLEQGGEIDCPACGTSFTLDAEQQECPECGIFLGVG